MQIYEYPVHRLISDWAKEHLSEDKSFRRSDLIGWFHENYPEVKDSTISAHLTAMSTNAPSRIHHPVRPGGGKDVFFKLSPDEFRLYDPGIDPEPIYRTPEIETSEQLEVEEEIQAEASETAGQFALEEHLKQYLVRNLNVLEPGLKPFFGTFRESMEVNVGGRFIDILAEGSEGELVVIELKVARGYDRVVGQILRYMGWLRENMASDRAVRGIIVANEISEDLILATRQVQNINLYSYELAFSVAPVGHI